MNHRYRLALVVGALTAVLLGCGGGGGDDSTSGSTGSGSTGSGSTGSGNAGSGNGGSGTAGGGTGSTGSTGSGSGNGNGGNVGNGSVTSGQTYALREAYKAYLSTRSKEFFDIVGTCTGTASVETAAATPVTFEGVAGVAVVQTIVLIGSGRNPTACVDGVRTLTTTLYHDSDYAPIGASLAGSFYGKFVPPAVPLPELAHAGDSGDLTTVALYASNANTVPRGHRVYSYAVESNGAGVLKLIAKDYDTAGRLASTTQFNYRLTLGPSLSLASVSVDDVPSSTHVVLTKN